MTDNLTAKDPDSLERFSVDWSDALATGDTVSTSTWALVGDGGGLVIGVAPPNDPTKDDTSTSVWLSAGDLGRTGQVVNSIVTANGEELDKTLTVRIRQQ
jgi:hypothetical protein